MNQDELETRVIFSALLPASRIAAEVAVPLKEMKRLIELAYYREVRGRGLKMREITDRLSISMSKISLLSKQLKEHFAQPESDYGLPRRILSLLWAGPLSEARIVQAFDDEEESVVVETLARLLDDGSLAIEDGRTPRYRLAAPQYRLVQEPWMARVDALNHLMSAVTRVVQARFFKGDERAFARTLSFRVRPGDQERLKKFYQEQLFPLIAELDERVEADGESVPMELSLLWAPQEEGGDEE